MITFSRSAYNLRKILIIFAAAVVLLLIGRIISQTVYASSNESRSGKHVLTIYDAGTTRGILTEADTLREALEQAEIQIDENDIAEPALDEKLVAASYEVNLYRARPVQVVDGETFTKVMTPYQTPKQIAEQAGLDLQPEDEVTLVHDDMVVMNGAYERLVVDRATEFTLVFYGKETTVYTRAETVGEMLKERDISLSEQDTLSTKSSSEIKNGMTVEIWRNGKQTITKEESVEFPIEQIQDKNRDIGYKNVRTPGVKGKKTVTYEIEMRNGKEVSRKSINSVVTKQPVKQVEVIGTKSNFSYTGGPLSETQINALGMCESHMTPTTNTGNGFYGAFQFMPATWRSVAPAPYANSLPHQAPLDVQKQAVQNLLSRSSIYTQFPGCARKMQAQGIL